MKEKVSIWFGKFSETKVLHDYVTQTYDENENVKPTKFEEDFLLGYYNYDTIEKKVLPSLTNNIKKLLDGFSYIEQFEHHLINEELFDKYDSAILLYGYDYLSEKEIIRHTEDIGEGYMIDFIGTAEYEW